METSLRRLCTRNLDLAKADAIISVLLKHLEMQTHPLALKLFDAVVSRIISRRTYKSSVLQYLYFGSKESQLHSSMGFAGNTTQLQDFLVALCKKRAEPDSAEIEQPEEMVPGSTNVEVNFIACLNQELKKVAKDGRAITKDNKDLKSVIQREMLLWDNEGIRGPNLNFACNSLRHIQCTSTESGGIFQSLGNL